MIVEHNSRIKYHKFIFQYLIVFYEDWKWITQKQLYSFSSLYFFHYHQKTIIDIYVFFCICIRIFQFWGVRVAQWVRSMDTTHSSLSPIRRGFAPGFVNYNKGCTRLATASDKVCQLLAHGRWFSLASSTTNTGRHDIAEILLKVALKHQKSNQIKSILEEYDYYLKKMQIGHNINIKNYHPVVYR